jgi:hypothetical protein
VFPVRYESYLHIKNKAITVTGCGVLEDCEILRIPYCVDIRLTDGGDFILTRRPRSAPQKHFYFCPWHSVLLEAEYIAEPSAVGSPRYIGEIELPHRFWASRPSCL